LRYVPFWTAFWIWFRFLTKDIDFLDELSMIIPAPNGLFVAQLSTTTEISVEIRTFINEAHTSDDRKLVRDLMISVSEPLLESPLSASPAVQIRHVDSGAAFLTLAVCRKLAPHCDALVRCLFPKKEGAASTPRAQEIFREQLYRLAAGAESFWDDFENLPLREFLTRANQSLLRRTALRNTSSAGKS